METFRRFRNSDPPRLMEVWNEAFTGRGAIRMRTSSPLERYAFSKPYFDPAGLVLAEEEGRCVGFAHAGFGPNAEESALDTSNGVIGLIAVRPAFQHRGIGTELLRRSEDYLRSRGASKLYAGLLHPLQPFYHGVYGGSDLPGMLISDGPAEPFLVKHGYRLARSIIVLQRDMGLPLKTSDARFGLIRQRYQLREEERLRLGSWWREAVYGSSEPTAFSLVDVKTGHAAGRAFTWEMEGFSYRWGHPSVGLFDLHVNPELRRQGLGKFLLTQILRHIQDQYFERVELQVPAENVGFLNLCKGLDFIQVDIGRSFERT